MYYGVDGYRILGATRGTWLVPLCVFRMMFCYTVEVVLFWTCTVLGTSLRFELRQTHTELHLRARTTEVPEE